MKTSSSKKNMLKIGVFGHVGNKNLGDEAIISSVIANIRIRLPQAQLIGFTTNDKDTRTRHHILAYPIRRKIAGRHCTSVESKAVYETNFVEKKRGIERLKDWVKGRPRFYWVLKLFVRISALIKEIPQEAAFLVRCYRNLKGVDLLIIAGSQQLIDYVGGPWAFPFTIFKWSVIAKIVNSKVVFLSVGAGPIYTKLGRFFDKTALSLATYRSYRDDSSCRCANQMGLKQDKFIVPDLVFNLRMPKLPKLGHSKTGPKVVGINPVPFGNSAYWIGGGASAYQKYVHTLASFGLWLIEKGYIVRLFPTQLNLDPLVGKDIKSIMEENAIDTIADKILDPPIKTLQELITSISSMDYVVATRYHGVVLSFTVNKPVLGIAYQPKTLELMHSFGQKDYVIDIADLHLEEMRLRFELLELNTEKAIQQIRQRVAACRKMVADQYGHVIKLLNRDVGFDRN